MIKPGIPVISAGSRD